MRVGSARLYARQLVVVAALVVAACHPARHREPFPRLESWLICDECIDGEREYVRRTGPSAVTGLDAALHGPSPQRLALMRAKLADAYRLAHRPGTDSSAYVNLRLSNFVATYQKRAAVSLGDIGTPEARQALERAIIDSAGRGYRSDVIRTIEAVRASASTPHVDARIVPGQVAFGDIVAVVAPPGVSFNDSQRVMLAGSPFSPNEIPVTRQSDTLRFPAVAPAGDHGVFVGTGLRTLVVNTGSVTITSLLDATDRSSLNCAPSNVGCMVATAPLLFDTIPAASVPPPASGGRVCKVGTAGCVTRLPYIVVSRTPSSTTFATFLVLSRVQTRPDSVDLLKIAPPDTVRTTILVDWRGPAAINTGWWRCSPFAPIAGALVSHAASGDSTAVSIPAHECWILRLTMGAGANGPAYIRVRTTRYLGVLGG